MVDLRKKYGDMYYKDMRGRVKSHPGGSFNNPEFAKEASQKGVDARKQKAKNKHNGEEIKASDSG